MVELEMGRFVNVGEDEWVNLDYVVRVGVYCVNRVDGVDVYQITGDMVYFDGNGVVFRRVKLSESSRDRVMLLGMMGGLLNGD